MKKELRYSGRHQVKGVYFVKEKEAAQLVKLDEWSYVTEADVPKEVKVKKEKDGTKHGTK